MFKAIVESLQGLIGAAQEGDRDRISKMINLMSLIIGLATFIVLGSQNQISESTWRSFGVTRFESLFWIALTLIVMFSIYCFCRVRLIQLRQNRKAKETKKLKNI